MRAEHQNRLRSTSLVALTLLALFVAPRPVFADADIYRQTLRATTLVFAKAGGTYSPICTGVLVNHERVLVITSLAAIGTVRQVAVCFPISRTGETVNDLASYTEHVDRLGIRGIVIATDPARDLALIELVSVPEDAVALRLADVGSQPGDEFHTITNRFSSENLWCYFSGRVRSVRRVKSASPTGAEQVSVAEVAAPLMPQSCGPVVNGNGELVGFFGKVVRNRLIDRFLDVSEIKAFLGINE